LDVLCQHILIRACAGPIDPDALYQEIKSVGAYSMVTRAQFEDCFDFCATGGYALRAYDKWKRLQERNDGTWALRDPRAAQRIRMNIGTIQDTDTLKVRLQKSRGGKPLGEIEEGFASTLTQGDTFLIGGQIVRYEGLREMTVEVTRRADKKPKVATFGGTKFATSTQLSQRILRMFQQDDWPDLPARTADWLTLQRGVSILPRPGRLLIESFPHEHRNHTVLYGFAGRNAQQTLGLLLSKRMEELGYDPLGFVATDHATLFWGLRAVTDPDALMDPDMMEQGLEQWLAGNALIKRTFRASATIAGLIERNLPSQRKNGRQATFSSDILYETLHKYDPEHLLLRITKQEALRGLVDFGRIRLMLEQTRGRIDFMTLKRVTPLAAPMFLEMGRIPIKGAAEERLLAAETAALMSAAGLA
jgi:ATP-dependent Lhr-like helicase